jgi:hypothetical protein
MDGRLPNMMRQRIATSCIPSLVLALTLAGQPTQSQFAPTTLTSTIRELAKGSPRSVIVYSGPQAAGVAQELQRVILRHPECKHKAEEVAVVPPEEAEQAYRDAAGKDTTGKRVSVLFIIVHREARSGMPSDLAALMPVRPEDVRPNEAVLECIGLSNTSPSGKAPLVMSVAMIAPDAAGLKRLLDRFVARAAPNFRQIPFTERYRLNRVARFCDPADEDAVRSWGVDSADPHSWNETRTYKLADRATIPAGELDGWSEAYFIDRSRRNQQVPEPAAKALADERVGELTTIVKRIDQNDGRSIVVFTAPDDLLLRGYVEKYPTIRETPGHEQADAIDLPVIGSTTLLVSGLSVGTDDKEVKEAIRTELGQDMGEKLKIDIQPRGDVLAVLQREVTLQDLLGATGTADLLRGKRLRYVWLFHLTECVRTTEYKPSDRLVSTNAPLPYKVAHASDDPEPVYDGYVAGPFSGRGRKEREANERAAWQPKYDAWRRRQLWYDSQLPPTTCEWELSTVRQESASVKGILQLVDLGSREGAAKMIWAKEADGSETGPAETYQPARRVTVQGVGTRPASLPTPPREDRCQPALLVRAARRAGGAAIAELRRTARLPDNSAPRKDDLPARVPSATTLAVADVSGSPSARISLAATLIRSTDRTPLSGKTVHFKVGTADVPSDATTKSDGTATCSYFVPDGASTQTITASFAGDDSEGASSGTGTLTVVPNPPPPSQGAAVADVDADNGIVIIALAPGDTVRVRDSAYVLMDKPIKDPATGEVIETRRVALIKLRVTHVSSKTADCVPSLLTEKSKLKLVKPGMAVKWEAAPKTGSGSDPAKTRHSSSR